MAAKKVSAKDRATDLRLQRTFGITLDEYNCIFEYQKKCCAICKKPVPKGGKRLAVDHCHITGKVRGLLCMSCNRALGKFRDLDELVINAGEYVTTPPARAALMREHFTAPGRVGTKVRAKLLLKMAAGVKSKQRGL